MLLATSKKSNVPSIAPENEAAFVYLDLLGGTEVALHVSTRSTYCHRANIIH